MADLGAARAEWESALASVPDQALTYLKGGDDYALGGLLLHVNWVLLHYHRLLNELIAGGFAAMDVNDPPGEQRAVNDRARVGLNAPERQLVMSEMDALHASVTRVVTGLADADWARKTPVVYEAGQDPHPTSPEDVIGWLRDHYREHVSQSADLVAEWRSSKA